MGLGLNELARETVGRSVRKQVPAKGTNSGATSEEEAALEYQCATSSVT